MQDTYKTIKSVSQGLFKDKGSRFIAIAYPVLNETEIKEILSELKKKYHDARHVCYAYKLNAENPAYRIHDDGEPSGTAGKPIYGQIQSFDITYVLIVVIRYFGGVLLGTGGLIQAYKSAAYDALKNAVFIEKTINDTIEITIEYLAINELMRIIHQCNALIVRQSFEEKCSCTLEIRKSKTTIFIEKLSLIKNSAWLLNKNT